MDGGGDSTCTCMQLMQSGVGAGGVCFGGLSVRRRLLAWFRRAVVSGIEGKYVKTLESGVAVVIFGFSFLWIFTVIE